MLPNKINDYQIISLIGEGNNGQVYKAKNLTNNSLFALKLEKPKRHSQFDNELKILQFLNNHKGFPHIIDLGKHLNQNYLILPLLGPNLQTYISKNRKDLSPESILTLASQCLLRVKTLHELGVIHRDLKPQQFLLNNFQINLIDFGLSKRFLHSGVMHIPYSENKGFVGTLNYASLNTHLGIQQSRRDDLESYCYTISYMIQGKLPWSRLKKNEKDVKIMKRGLNGSELFDDSNLVQIFKYIRSLNFEESPNYELIIRFLNISLQGAKSKIYRVKFSDEGGIKSSSLKKKPKKSRKLRPSLSQNRFKELLHDNHENSLTLVSKALPEIKDRRIIQKSSCIFDNKTLY